MHKDDGAPAWKDQVGHSRKPRSVQPEAQTAPVQETPHGQFGRGILDAAHELGHLALHRHASPSGQQAEQDANAFASALLMPAASVRAHAPRFATLDQLMRLKKIWGVSLAAITYRLHRLGLLSDWHYRKLYTELSKRGYRKAEPDGGPRETSQVLQKVFAALRSDGVSKHAIAEALGVHPGDVNELVFGLALTALDGDAGATRSVRSSIRPRLTIV